MHKRQIRQITGTNNNDKPSNMTSYSSIPLENILSYSPFKDRFDVKIGTMEKIRENNVVQKETAFMPIMFRLSVIIIKNDPITGIKAVINAIDNPNIKTS